MSFPLAPAVTDALCAATAILCAGLLYRSWARTRSRLLLWTAVSFSFLAIEGLLLMLDLFVFRTVDLWPFRAISFDTAMLVLLCGFIWEAD